jgi:2-oxo-3-hexenedioate decarboxylase
MLADELIAVHENAGTVAPFTDREPGLTPAEAYGAAAALHASRLRAGWRPVGRKIGFTNRTIWARYGVYEPIWGIVYDRTLVRDASAFPLGGLVQPRIEPEVCFGLKATPRSAAAKDLLEAIEWVAHSVEIVQCHHPEWKVKLADCCAGNGLHGRLLVGPRIPIAKFSNLENDLPKIEIVLKKAGVEVDRGVGANVLGSPLAALGYFVDVLRRQPGAPPLAPGELVTTGTLTDAHPVAPGETWSTEIRGLALDGAAVRFVD